jgi:hypothetical protein
VQLGTGQARINPEKATAAQEALDVVVKANHVGEAVIRIPVRSDALEDAGAVVKGLSRHREARLADAGPSPVHPAPRYG